MKAATWTGTKSITLDTVPRPTITAAKDVIVHITNCTICGSDLHVYAGEMNSAMEKCLIMGHEAIGIVGEVGPEVKSLKEGDWVGICPVIACGEFFYCKCKEFSLCNTANPTREMEAIYGHRLLGIFGYSRLTGGYPGNQAEYFRVPNADLVCVKAKFCGAKRVYAIDKDPNRLKLAKSYGMIPTDVNAHSDPADYILSIETPRPG